jgi:hypothetical protein
VFQDEVGDDQVIRLVGQGPKPAVVHCFFTEVGVALDVRIDVETVHRAAQLDEEPRGWTLRPRPQLQRPPGIAGMTADEVEELDRPVHPARPRPVEPLDVPVLPMPRRRGRR